MTIYRMISGRWPFYGDRAALEEAIKKRAPTYTFDASSDGHSVLRGLLRKDPEMRLGGRGRDAAEVKEHHFFSKISWCGMLARTSEATPKSSRGEGVIKEPKSFS